MPSQGRKAGPVKITHAMQAAFEEGFREGISRSLGLRIKSREDEEANWPKAFAPEPLPMAMKGDIPFYDVIRQIDEVLAKENE